MPISGPGGLSQVVLRCPYGAGNQTWGTVHVKHLALTLKLTPQPQTIAFLCFPLLSSEGRSFGGENPGTPHTLEVSRHAQIQVTFLEAEGRAELSRRARAPSQTARGSQTRDPRGQSIRVTFYFYIGFEWESFKVKFIESMMPHRFSFHFCFLSKGESHSVRSGSCW